MADAAPHCRRGLPALRACPVGRTGGLQSDGNPRPRHGGRRNHGFLRSADFCGEAIAARPLTPETLVETHLNWRRKGLNDAMRRFVETSHRMAKLQLAGLTKPTSIVFPVPSDAEASILGTSPAPPCCRHARDRRRRRRRSRHRRISRRCRRGSRRPRPTPCRRYIRAALWCRARSPGTSTTSTRNSADVESINASYLGAYQPTRRCWASPKMLASASDGTGDYGGSSNSSQPVKFQPSAGSLFDKAAHRVVEALASPIGGCNLPTSVSGVRGRAAIASPQEKSGTLRKKP